MKKTIFKLRRITAVNVIAAMLICSGNTPVTAGNYEGRIRISQKSTPSNASEEVNEEDYDIIHIEDDISGQSSSSNAETASASNAETASASNAKESTVSRSPEQTEMPFIAEDLGSPDNLSVADIGQALHITQTGGTMTTNDSSIDSSVSYYLFPETSEWHTLAADITLEECGSSNTNGVFFGAFDGTYLSTIAIRNKTNIRGIYSKSVSELTGAGGPNATIGEKETVTFQVKKTTDGLLITYESENGTKGSNTYKYNSSSNLLFYGNEDGSKPCFFGFAFANVSVSVRNMVLEDKDGAILYDQNEYYDPAGTAPIPASVSAIADESREFIRVFWEGDDCEGDGKYILQVSRDGTNYEDAAVNLTEKTYDYPIIEEGYYYFKVCGTLGSGSGDYRTSYAVIGSPVYVKAALPAPVVQASASASSIVLTWDAVETATSYEIYRYSYDETVSAATLTATVNAPGYTDENVTQQMPYYYYVKAISDSNYSNGSAAVWAVPTGVRYGSYVYEDDAVNVFITKKSYNTVYTDSILIEGIVEADCLLTAEVNGSEQGETLSLAGRDQFHLSLSCT